MPIVDDDYDVKLDGAELLGASNKWADTMIREFQSLVGSLLWIARCTRPDIAFTVHKASRQTHAPTCMIKNLRRELIDI